MTIDQAALEFLRRDVLGNLPMLKMIAHDLRGRGLVARYQTAEDNAASRAVAEVAGCVPFLTLEHWRTDRSA